MATADVGISLDLKGRREAAAGLDDTAKNVDKIGDAAQRTSRKTNLALTALTGLGKVALGAAKVGTIALGALATAGAAVGLKTAAANEQAQISFTTMLGSAQRASSFITDLQAFAAKTPFDFAGLQTAASSLISVGIKASDVIPIMTSLGNATAGMGTGAEGIQRATVALQQMTAAQKISAEDLNQLRDAGIPVYDLLSKATGKSTAEVSKLVQAGKLGSKELNQLMAALRSGKGLERFNGLMDAQSASLTGMWSTLMDNTSQGLARVFAPWVPTVKLALQRLTDAAGPMFTKLTEWSTDLSAKGPWAVNMVTRAVRSAIPQAQRFMTALRGASDGKATGGLAQVGATLHTIGTNLGQIDWSGVGAGLQQNIPGLNSGLTVLGVVTGFLADHASTLARWMPVLAAGFLLWRAAQVLSTAVTLASIPVEFAKIGATIMNANATRMLAIAIAQANGQTVKGRIATLASNAATVVSTAITGARTVATMLLAGAQQRQVSGLVAGTLASRAYAIGSAAATAAQWALNVALNANPLGLVVLAVMAVVGVAILLWKNWDKVTASVGWAWNKLKDFWGWVQKVGGGLAKWLGFGSDDTTSKAKANATAAAGAQHRALGGNVTRGNVYEVNEQGREFFRPASSGSIIPVGPQADELGGSLAGAVTIHVNSYLDGRQVSESVVRNVKSQVARK